LEAPSGFEPEMEVLQWFQRYNIVSDGDLREAAHKLNVAAGQ
jgi:hypothetical protein